MELLNITIIVVLAVLTLVFVGVGIYLVILLNKLKGTLKKVDSILEDVETTTKAVSSPISTVAGILAGFAESLHAVKSVNSLFRNQKKGGK